MLHPRSTSSDASALRMLTAILAGAACAIPALAAHAGAAAPARLAIANERAHPAHVVLRVQPGLTPDRLAAIDRSIQADAVLYQSALVPGLRCLQVPSGSVNAAIAILNANTDVLYAEPDYLVRTQVTQTPQPGIVAVGGPSVWPLSRGSGIICADLDTGVDLLHPDLPHPLETATFVTNQSVQDGHGHGTHTAGIIAAQDNLGGVVGVAPSASLIIGKVLGDDGSGYDTWVAAGIDWAVAHHARVINMSLGGPDYSQALQDSCDAALAADTLVVAAAGNSGNNLDFYPAKFASVLAVSAVDSRGVRTNWSNFGPHISVCAPGQSVYSTYKNRSYTSMSGTSMAAPHVTGVAALLMGLYPTTYNALQIRQAIQVGSVDKGAAGRDDYYGNGEAQALNSRNYLDLVTTTAACPGTFAAATPVASLPGTQLVTTADLDGDGRPDLLLAASNAISVFLAGSNGQFSLAAATNVASQPTCLATGDIDRDGRPDLVVGTTSSVTIFRGNGDGSFQAPMSLPAAQVKALVLADLNRDGILDIVTACDGTAAIAFIWLGNSDGSFQSMVSLGAGQGTSHTGLAVADFNGDTFQDIAASNTASNSISVFSGAGNGSFASQANYATGAAPTQLTAADFNADGKADLALVTGAPALVTVFASTPAGVFASPVNFGLSGGTTSVAVADCNGDGRPDLLLTSATAGTTSLLLGNGNATFGFAVDIPAGAAPFDIRPADINGDAVPDLFVLNSLSGQVSALLGHWPRPVLSVQPFPQNLHTGQTAAFTVVAQSGTASSFQWKRNGVNLSNGLSVTGAAIAGANTPTLTISNIAPADAASYSCLLTNNCGTLTSQPATLAVTTPCRGDFNQDGGIDFFDYLDFVGAFGAVDPAADLNEDGSIDFFDYLDFVDLFTAGC